MNINKVVVIGRLTADPEIKFTPSGKGVCSFSLAVSKFKKDETSFFNVVAWDKTAEYVSTYLKKGNLIAVEGRLDQRTWEKDGAKRSTVEIIAEKIQGLEKKPAAEKAPGPAPAESAPAGWAPDEDLPF